MGLFSSGEDIFLCAGTEEYITVIFLDIDEFKNPKEHM
jgi:hypothetical protein